LFSTVLFSRSCHGKPWSVSGRGFNDSGSEPLPCNYPNLRYQAQLARHSQAFNKDKINNEIRKNDVGQCSKMPQNRENSLLLDQAPQQADDRLAGWGAIEDL
jgi:hypothetical protein